MKWNEVLGIAPSASESEIVAAYRHLAKLLHPDTAATADDATRRLRQIQMATLNQAYREARAVESARIRDRPPKVAFEDSASRPLQHPTPRRVTDGVSAPMPDAPRSDDTDDEAPSVRITGHRPRWALRVGGVALVVAVGLGVVLARSSQAPREPVVDSCIVWSGGYRASPCDQPHSGRIVEAVSVAAECPSRSAYMATASRILCIDTSR